MKQELEAKLVEILSGIQTAVSKGSDFVVAELPDVAQSYIVFGTVWAFTYAAMLVLVVVVGAYAILKLFNRWHDAPYTAFLIFPSMAVAGLAMAIPYALRDLLLVWFAPKVWLLQEIARMVK